MCKEMQTKPERKKKSHERISRKEGWMDNNGYNAAKVNEAKVNDIRRKYTCFYTLYIVISHPIHPFVKLWLKVLRLNSALSLYTYPLLNKTLFHNMTCLSSWI